MQNDNKPVYNAQRKKSANNHLFFRIAISAYLAYVTYNLFNLTITGQASMPLFVAYLVIAFFAAATIFIAISSYKSYKKALLLAEATPEELLELENIKKEDEQ